MELGFFVGLALGIPISIGANLLTPIVQKRLARYNSRLRESLKKRAQQKQEIVDWFAQNLPAFTIYLVRELGNVALWLAFSVIFAVFFSMVIALDAGTAGDTSIILSIGDEEISDEEIVGILTGMLTIVCLAIGVRILQQVSSVFSGVKKAAEWRPQGLLSMSVKSAPEGEDAPQPSRDDATPRQDQLDGEPTNERSGVQQRGTATDPA